MTATRRLTPLLILAAAVALTGCGAASTSTTAPPPTIPPQVISSPSASALAAPNPNPSPSPSAVYCTSHSCIAQDAEQSMVGTSAKDGSVVTKADCFKSTVKANPGDTYTVSCDITYTDGTVWNGLVTLLLASNQVSWQPETEVQ